jgi:predicted RNA binding protein YcfA (HicA-like mRNA interferase family)
MGWKEVLKALKKKGFYPTRQTGSHIIVENGRGQWTAVPRKKSLEKDCYLKLSPNVVLQKRVSRTTVEPYAIHNPKRFLKK